MLVRLGTSLPTSSVPRALLTALLGYHGPEEGFTRSELPDLCQSPPHYPGIASRPDGI